MILDHDDDGTLIDGEEGIRVPAAALTEGVHESVAAPHLVAVAAQEVAQGREGFVRCVGQARECRGGRYRAVVVGRIMHCIAIRTVTGSQTPALRAVAGVAMRVGGAVGMIDAHMRQILLPVVGVAVLQAMRIQAAEGVVGEEQRTADRACPAAA